MDSTVGDGHEALLRALSHDANVAFFEEEVGESQVGELANTQPTREQHFDDGAIALSLRLRAVDAGFQLVDLSGGEHFRQMFAQAWRLKQLGGVGIDAAVE